MGPNLVLPIMLASLPLAAGATAQASASVRIVKKEWLAKRDPRLLAASRTVTGVSNGTVQEHGVTYILLTLNGNVFRFEAPPGLEIPNGKLRIGYVPLYEKGRQRLVAMTIEGHVLH